MSNLYALDCEMVGDTSNQSMVARVSVVNSSSDLVLDDYVKPTREIQDYRTPISGIRPGFEYQAKHIQNVRERLLNLLRGSTLIGYDIEKDLSVLGIQHGDVKDLGKHQPFMRKYGQKPSLKMLAQNELGMQIQNGAHNSVEDAKATMRIYLRNRF